MSPLFMSSSHSPVLSGSYHEKNTSTSDNNNVQQQSSQALEFAIAVPMSNTNTVAAAAAPMSTLNVPSSQSHSPASSSSSNSYNLMRRAPLISGGAPFVFSRELVDSNDDELESKEMLSKYRFELASKTPYFHPHHPHHTLKYTPQYQQKYFSHAMNPFADESITESGFKLPNSTFDQFGKNPAYYYGTSQLATVLSMSPPISSTSISSPTDSEHNSGKLSFMDQHQNNIQQQQKQDHDCDNNNKPRCGNNNDNKKANEKCESEKKPSKRSKKNNNNSGNKSRKQQQQTSATNKRRGSKDSYNSTDSNRNSMDQGNNEKNNLDNGTVNTAASSYYMGYGSDQTNYGSFQAFFNHRPNSPNQIISQSSPNSDHSQSIHMAGRAAASTYFMATTANHSTGQSAVSSHFYW